MKILIIFLVGFLSFLSNQSMFFFSEELLIAFSLVLFFILIVSLLRTFFLRTFFMEIKAIYTVFYYLFMLNLKFIFIVTQCVNFLTLKYKYSFGGEFYFSITNSYISYLNFQKQQVLSVVDNFVSDILKRFFLHFFKIFKFSLNLKQQFLNSSLYSKIQLEKIIIKTNYKFIC